jgi:hypothetical protein
MKPPENPFPNGWFPVPLKRKRKSAGKQYDEGMNSLLRSYFEMDIKIENPERKYQFLAGLTL